MRLFILVACIMPFPKFALPFMANVLQDSTYVKEIPYEGSSTTKERVSVNKALSLFSGIISRPIHNTSDRIGFSESVAKKTIEFHGCNDSSVSLFFSDNSAFKSTVEIGEGSVQMPSKRTPLEFKSFYSTFDKAVTLYNVDISLISHFNNYTDVEYYDCDINHVNLLNDSFSSLYFLGCNFRMKSLEFDVTFHKGLYFEQCLLPDTINFLSSNIEGVVKFEPPREGKVVKLIIGRYFPIEKLEATFSSYELVFSSKLDAAEIESMYRKTIAVQREIGSQKDIDLAEIALKDYLVKQGDIFLGLQKFLWNYGYDKPLLIKRLLFCFIFFWVINLSLFRILIEEVYIISNLKSEYYKLREHKYNKTKYFRFPLIVFIYSFIVFFGWKMDIDKFPFKHLIMSLYLFTFYLIGLGLLFYTVGLLLVKG